MSKERKTKRRPKIEQGKERKEEGWKKKKVRHAGATFGERQRCSKRNLAGAEKKVFLFELKSSSGSPLPLSS